MENAINDLERYILKHIDNTNIIDKILKFNLKMLLSHLIKNIDKHEYQLTQYAIRRQKELNEVFFNEMKSITTNFNKRNMKIIFFKGITLAFDLYPESFLRKCGDIDALINIDNLKDALTIFRSMDYSIDDKCFIDDLLQKKVELIKQGLIHIPQFRKNVIINSKTYEIKFDLHISMTHFSSNKMKITKQIICRSVENPVNNYEMRLLELHDRIVHLCYHATKEHIKNEYFWIISSSGELVRHLKLSLFCDIALLLDKYKLKINWNIFIERVIEWKQTGSILYSLTIVDCIFHSRIPSWVIKKIKAIYENEYRQIIKSFYNQSLEILLKENADSLILKDPLELISFVLKKIKYKGPQLICPKKSNLPTIDYSNFFIVKEFMNYLPNIENSNIHSYDTEAKNIAEGNVCWNETNFYLKLKIQRKFVISKKIPFFSIYISNFHYINDLCAFIPRIIFYPIIENNSTDVIIKYKNNQLNCFEKGKIKISSTHYTIFVSIPWSFLHFTPVIGQKLLFYFELENHNEHEEEIRDRLAWVVGFDPALFGILTLN